MIKHFSILTLTAAALLIGVTMVSAQDQTITQPTCDPYQVGQSSFVVQSSDLSAPAASAVDATVMQDIVINPQVLNQITGNVVGIARDRAEFANPATHLVLAKAAIVTSPGDALKVYTGNCVESAVLAQLPTGARVVVLDGPLASEGYAWWRVRRGNLTGWVIEGQDSEIWLQGLS